MDSRINYASYFIRKQLAVIALMMIVASTLSCSNEPESSIRSDARDKLANQIEHTDHSGFFNKPFADGPSVTRACLQCHEDSAQQVMQDRSLELAGPGSHVTRT